MWSQSKFEKHRRKLAPNSIYAVVSAYTFDISLYSWNLTLVCPTKPNSSLPLDKIKLKWSFRGSNRWDWMSSWPLEQGTFRYMVWIESHKIRHTRFSNILQAQRISGYNKNHQLHQRNLFFWRQSIFTIWKNLSRTEMLILWSYTVAISR